MSAYAITSAMSSIWTRQSVPFSADTCLKVFTPVFRAVLVAFASFCGSIHFFGWMIHSCSRYFSLFSQKSGAEICPARTQEITKVS